MSTAAIFDSADERHALSPIIKWAGGKEKELKFILPGVPEFDNYFEPFVGGGSVFTSVGGSHNFINDKSTELISLYKAIATQDNDFFTYAYAVDSVWQRMLEHIRRFATPVDIYFQFRDSQITEQSTIQALKEYLKSHRSNFLNIVSEFGTHQDIFLHELDKNLVRKVLRMRSIEQQKHRMPDSDVFDNIETAMMSALYMYFRSLYNDRALMTCNPALLTAMFFFIRNYAYSGMFRYNNKGEFNVPYGGIAYNHKLLERKLKYYSSEALINLFSRTTVTNLDFEEFLTLHSPRENDFVFLDPPYDSEFSTYDRNEFTRADQERLANYLIHRCNARWMMVIKYTPYIYELYAGHNLNIQTFDKKYLVSFMNRNNRRAEHLLITNY